MTTLWFEPRLDDPTRRKAVFGGAVAVYRASVATRALGDYAREMIADAFRGLDPRLAQHDLSVEAFVERAGPLKTRFTNDAGTKSRLRNLLAEYGCDVERTAFDVPRLRIVTGSGYLSAGVGYAYKPHRDTWYAAPLSQINWWSPLYDLIPEQSLGFYPSHFERAVANTSEVFDYGDWQMNGRKAAAAQVKEDTRQHPVPSEPLNPQELLSICTAADGMLVFSSNQLHVTIPNTANSTRFSIDFRTVSQDDVAQGEGAPNTDSKATGSTLGDFFRASDFSEAAYR
jgi:hypothetical protein